MKKLKKATQYSSNITNISTNPIEKMNKITINLLKP